MSYKLTECIEDSSSRQREEELSRRVAEIQLDLLEEEGDEDALLEEQARALAELHILRSAK